MDSKNTLFINSILVVLIVIAISAFTISFVFKEKIDFFTKPPVNDVPVAQPVAPVLVTIQKNISGFKQFTSEKEFKEYLLKAEEQAVFFGGSIRKAVSAPTAFPDGEAVSGIGPMSAGNAMQESLPQRVSETNIQVAGIDEPDIVKTNGKEIYLSSEFYNIMPMRGGSMMEESIAPDFHQQGETKIIKAFPPAALAKLSAINKSGNLLLSENILAVFSGNKIYGYDISNPASSTEKWLVEVKDNSHFIEARLRNGKIYVVTGKNINKYDPKPCPIEPLASKGIAVSVPCDNIYHPETIVPANTTYTMSVINPKSGEITAGVSFVGSYDSVIYMSSNAVYVAYNYSGDYLEFFYNFLKENKDLLPNALFERIGKLLGYDISRQSKLVELATIMEEYSSSLSSDDRLKFENEMQNKMDSYMKQHKRELEKTDIVKINISDFKAEAVGTVPGQLLNQFSIDEYEGNLRVAVNIGAGGSFGFSGSAAGAENDVYVLDKDMQIVGRVEGLGVDERIYSARFVADKGYVVTFRQTDPFYVIDMSDPKNPALKGELKIPGYSSYLHPIDKDRIVGVGKEGSNVKISLFNVSDPSNPTEASKYVLTDYWSDVLNTHHAFLMDTKHEIFFMPGSKGGYVLSYKNNELKLIKAVGDINARRALYLDDYLYVVGDNKITALSELDWSTVKELGL